MDYWSECIKEACEDAGLSATTEQINTIAGWAEGAHDNYGMAHGYDAIPNPKDTEIEELKRKHAKEIQELNEREACYKRSVAARRNTKPENVWIENGNVMYE